MQRQLTILLLAVLHLTSSFDLTTYKNQYQTQVGVPYKNAVTIVASSIIEYLALAPVPTTDAEGQDIVDNINLAAEYLSSYLGTASTSSDVLRQQLDTEEVNLVAQGSAVEQQIAANEQQLQQTNAQLQQTNAQLVDAQNQLNNAQQAVTNAINNLNKARDDVDHAKNHCTFIGGFFGKKICSVINHGGIDGAEGDRDRAQAALTGEQQRFDVLRSTQAQYVQQQGVLQRNQASFSAQKTNMNAQLVQLNQGRNNVNNVDTALKALILHVQTLFGKSKVLADVVKDLIDMETVIKPLTAIADQIIGYTSDAADIAFLNVMKQEISATLPFVLKKLPQYALILPAETTSAAPSQTRSIITAPGELKMAECLLSPNGAYRACLKTDGNFVVYDAGMKPLWSTNTVFGVGPTYSLVMQLDNNLVLYQSGVAIARWASGTVGKGQRPTQLWMQDDGNLVVYGAPGFGNPLWSWKFP